MVNLVGLITSPISDIASFSVGVLSVIFALVSILIGIWVTGRVAGKLKSAAVFLILAIAVIIVKEILALANVVYASFIVGIMRVATVFFILLAILSMKKMIDRVDNHYKKK